MFDTIVQVEFFQIKSILTVTFLEHASGKMRHIRAEGRTEIVSRPNTVVKVDK
jgi:phage major head subunit gpT-like protein